MRIVVRYLGAIASDTTALMSGGLSVLVWLLAAFATDLVPVRWGLWIAGVVGVIVASFRVWKRESDARQQLAEQLTPRLEICSVPERIGDHARVRVRNLSRTTIRFAARLDSVTPNIGYALPVPLRHTHQPPQPEAEIPSRGSACVDVFADRGVEGVRLLVMGDPPEVGILLPSQGRHEICITAYPTTPAGGIAASRRFYIIHPPQPGGPIVFSDAGAPPG